MPEIIQDVWKAFVGHSDWWIGEFYMPKYNFTYQVGILYCSFPETALAFAGHSDWWIYRFYRCGYRLGWLWPWDWRVSESLCIRKNIQLVEYILDSNDNDSLLLLEEKWNEADLAVFIPFQCLWQLLVFHLYEDFLSNFVLILIILNLSLWVLYYTVTLWNAHLWTTLGCSFTCYQWKFNLFKSSLWICHFENY